MRQVPDMSRACCRYARLDWRRRIFPRLDAVEEILHVGDGPVSKAVRGKHRILTLIQMLPMDREPATIELQRGLGAAKLEPTIVDRGIHHALIYNVEPGIAK